MRITSLVAFTLILGACADGKDDAKGVVDDSSPPSDPTVAGKADDLSRTVAVDVQSAHPYANNLNRTYTVPYAALPSCAQRVRLHFAALQTEAGYDFVTVEPTGAPAQSFDGNLTARWTEWFPTSGTGAKVRLRTDDSITRHGFAIDKIEWEGTPLACPAPPDIVCAADEVDITPATAACACPSPTVCAPAAQIEVTHRLYRGFNRTAHSTIGNQASETHPGLADGAETTALGRVDLDRIVDLVERANNAGLLRSGGYEHANPATGTALTSDFQIDVGGVSVNFIAAENTHEPAVQELIAEFEALFQCGTPTGSLECGAGLTCEEGTCIEEQSCVCPAYYAPVCSTSGTTYSNACAASCANAEVAHSGECGLPGDPCGTIRGLSCRDDNRCRFGEGQFEYPYPDAGGTCVAKNYCDAAVDCNGLPHPAVPGAWACNANACAWAAGVQWQTPANGVFETAHPYANNASVWKQVTLPSSAQALRLRAAPGFSLEAGYDFLEVWAWQGGQWKQVKRYTGTAGPALTDEIAGRYFYLKFVSDSTVTKFGFKVAAEYR